MIVLYRVLQALGFALAVVSMAIAVGLLVDRLLARWLRH